MKVAIIGGGIAGLSAAHYLSKYPNIQVDVYEKETFIGGQAASAMGKKCHIEYSWRIFGQSYDNLNWVIRDMEIDNNFVEVRDSCMISGSKIQKGTLSVFDLAHQLLTMSGEEDRPISVINKLVGLSMMCRKRAVTEFDDVNAFEYFERNPVMQTIMGPYMGLDANKISLSAFMKNVYATRDSGKEWAPKSVRISRNPTSISLFNPWVDYLSDAGVKIHTNMGVMEIYTSDGKISGLKMTGGVDIKADAYIFASSLPGILPILSGTPELANLPTVQNMMNLRDGLQLYYTFNIYFNRHVGDCPEAIIVDMPWKPIIQKKRQWQVMGECNPDIVDVWNVGFLDYNEGIKIKKILRECSHVEAQQEGLYQIQNSKYMQDILASMGVKWEDIYLGMEDWPQFRNDESGKLISTNPKFSTNVGLEKFMPSPRPDDIPKNMYLAGYYCASTNGGASMEASCETGFAAARTLVEDIGRDPLSAKNKGNIVFFPIKHDAQYIATIAAPLVYLDKGMYNLGLFSLGEYLPPWFVLIIYFVLVILLIYGVSYGITRLFAQ